MIPRMTQVLALVSAGVYRESTIPMRGQDEENAPRIELRDQGAPSAEPHRIESEKLRLIWENW